MEVSAHIAKSYEELPYQTYARRDSHPAHLRTMARLLGLEAADPAAARVLELGCGTGGNLVPLAERYPKAQFLGVDIADSHISAARKTATELGLSNLRFARKSILDVTPADGTFDYIICHGVYSWVPDTVRDKILAILRDNLDASGVGYLSYNTCPGWRFRGAVREIMMYHASFFNDAESKLRESLGIVDFLSRLRGGTSDGYSLTLRETAEKLSKSQPNYVFHEFLEPVNVPMYFHEFHELLKPFELRYLSDAKIQLTQDEDLPLEVRKTLDQFRSDSVRFEQYLDFIRNRSFRESLIVKASARPSSSADWDVLERCHISSAVVLEEREGGRVFVDRVGKAVTPRDGGELDLMTKVSEAWPGSIPFRELRAEYPRLDVTALVRTLSLRAIFEFDLAPSPSTRIRSDRPITSALARYLATRSEIVTSPLSFSVQVNDIARVLIAQLDGRSSVQEIEDTIRKLVETNPEEAIEEAWKAAVVNGFLLA